MCVCLWTSSGQNWCHNSSVHSQKLRHCFACTKCSIIIDWIDLNTRGHKMRHEEISLIQPYVFEIIFPKSNLNKTKQKTKKCWAPQGTLPPPKNLKPITNSLERHNVDNLGPQTKHTIPGLALAGCRSCNSSSKCKNGATRGWGSSPWAVKFQDFWEGSLHPNQILSFSTLKLKLPEGDSKTSNLIKAFFFFFFHIEVTGFHRVQRVANPAVSRLHCSARQVLFSF